MQGKIPQNGSVGALHDSKLQKFLLSCGLAPVCRLYTVMLSGHEAVNVCFMNGRLFAQ